MSEPIKGYKVFNPDWTCRNFQYEVGKTFIYFSPGGDCTGHSQAAYLQLAGTAND